MIEHFSNYWVSLGMALVCLGIIGEALLTSRRERRERRRSAEEIAEVQARKMSTLPGAISWIQTAPLGLRVTDAKIADNAVVEGFPKPTPEEIWAEWCHDKWDFDMDLDLFVRKWRGRVPKKPREMGEFLVVSVDSAVRVCNIDISDFMKKVESDAAAEGVDTELLMKLTEMKINAQANRERKSGYLFRGVDVTDLLHEPGSTIELLRRCKHRVDRSRGNLNLFPRGYAQVWKNVG